MKTADSSYLAVDFVEQLIVALYRNPIRAGQLADDMPLRRVTLTRAGVAYSLQGINYQFGLVHEILKIGQAHVDSICGTGLFEDISVIRARIRRRVKSAGLRLRLDARVKYSPQFKITYHTVMRDLPIVVETTGGEL